MLRKERKILDMKKDVDFYISNEKRLLPIKGDNKDAISYLCVFPDFYEYGLPNIGLQTIYRECHYHKNVIPDRYYLPQEHWERKDLSLERKNLQKIMILLGLLYPMKARI